ncbi:extensin [Rhizobium sp. TH135]|uniref:extensin-like domain-containing protein n=1 Tax=Rhizobium sp. TH135 TaxID=2067451 RepID=UPI000C79F2CE|nr:extensin family protein [Rhizobium sp. TH135]PLK72441.1 extensin [Rhizobium sp. TH135]
MRTVTRLTLIWLAATGVTLPQTGPAPVPKPGEPTVESGSETVTKPEDGTTAADPGEQPALPSGNAPKPLADPRDEADPAPADAEKPEAKPETPSRDHEADVKERPAKPEAAAPPPPPDPAPVAETPEDLALCLKDLKAIGADFSQEQTIDGEFGCGIANPVTVRRILPEVALEPEATLRCDTALSLARMTRDMLIPAAARAFPDKPKLSGVGQASGYVCRNRNSADDGKISEHAYGNAVDIAGLSFGDEKMPVMIARQDDGTAEAAFQRAFNALACLYFTTVLSPGSDATHQDHMHLDVIERKSGFRYCR